MTKHLVIRGFLYTIFTMNAIASLYAQNEGKQSLKVSGIDRSVKVSDLRQVPFFLAGKSLYEIGFMNSSFPTQGNETEERGVWSHPIKLLIEMYLQIPNDLDYLTIDGIEIGNDSFSVSWKKTIDKRLLIQIDGGVTNKVKEVIVRINSSLPYKVLLNGKKKKRWKKEDFYGIDTEMKVLCLP